MGKKVGVSERNITRQGVAYMRLGSEFGQEFTDMVRQIAWWECHRDKALLMMIGSLHGMTLDQAEAVIDGKYKFKTDEDGKSVSFLEDNWTPPYKEIEEAKKIVNDALMYIGHPSVMQNKRKPMGGMWIDHLPYSGDREDLWQEGTEILRIMKRGEIWEAKSRAYFLHSHAEYKMREACDIRRAWKEGRTSYIEEVDEGKMAEAAMEIEDAKEDVMDTVMDKITAEAIEGLAQSDLSEEMKRRLIRTTAGITEAFKGRVKIVEDDKFIYDTGWLSPEGKYYGCEIGQHIALSDLLKEKFLGDEKGDAEQRLEEHGWMKCTGARWYEGEKKPTPAQVLTLSKWKAKWRKHEYHTNQKNWEEK